MNRRHFLKGTALASAAAFAPAIQPSAAYANGWRDFELVTKVTLDPERGASRVWVPIPTHVQLEHQKPIANTCQGNYSRAGIFREPVYGCEGVYAEWTGADAKIPMKLEVFSRVAVRDRVADLGKPDGQGDKVPDDVPLYLKGTPSAPTDGIVLTTAQKIAGDRRSAIDKARAVYDWILENGVRDPNITGCGTGDVVGMLETGNTAASAPTSMDCSSRWCARSACRHATYTASASPTRASTRASESRATSARASTAVLNSGRTASAGFRSMAPMC